MVVLIADAQLKRDGRDEFIKHATQMLEPSRAEEACLKYEFFTEPSNDLHLVFVEEWTSRDGLEFHFNTPHFKQFRELTGHLTESVSIRIYEVGEYEDL